MDTDELKVSTTQLLGPKLGGLQSTALLMALAGAVLTVASILIGSVRPVDFYASWLVGWVLFLGVTAGSLGLLMLHHTVGGGWGFVMRRFWEAAANPLMFGVVAVLFAPILVGLFGLWGGHFYSWADPAHAGDAILAQKAGWLNPIAFVVRFVFYFLFFIVFATMMKNWGATQYVRVDLSNSDRLNRWSAFGILLFAIVGTFCSIDFVMSLTPKWVSSIFGLLWIASQALTSMAFLLGLLGVLGGDTGLLRGLPSKYFRDLGNLTLAMVMMWAYMAFSQYLIQFSGNTAEEVEWFVARVKTPWVFVGTMLVLFHFFLPFLVLLVGSDVKKNPTRLAQVAWFLLFMRLVDIWWWIVPTFRPLPIPSLTDIGCPLLIGGIWLFFFANNLKDRPAVPLYDPRLQANLAELHEAHAHG